MPDSQPERDRTIRTRLVDAAIVVGISVLAAFGSGSRTWTGFNSPDSEFYASLALFGSDVTDRSIDPAYTWTRLGYIAPVRLLVTSLDPWAGFALWRLLLILLIVGSVYAIVRITSTRQLAVLTSAAAALNTVVLSFVGNSYLTGTILAATCLLLALGVWGCLGHPRQAWLPALLSGATAGWLVMLNPYALLLGLTMWIGLRAIPLVADRAGRWRLLGRDALLALGGFVVAMGLLLAAGAVIFPGRNWFSTYLEWNGRLDYGSFVGDPNVWQRDIALLVPAVAVVVAVIAVIATRSRAAVAAVVVSLGNLAFTAVYIVLVPGPWLEAPTYVAKLWPGALVAIALSLASIVGRRSLGVAGWTVAALSLPLVLWSGRWDDDVAVAGGLVVAAAAVVVFAVAAVVGGRTSGPVFSVLVVAALAVIAIGSQVLQNGRGPLGIYGQFPLRAAYVDFDAELLMRSRVAAQQWVLDHTSRDDSVGIWTDPDRLTSGIAAMQLWGAYNNVSELPALSRDETDRLEATRPTALALYAPTREQIDVFASSLPPWARATPLECTTVPFLGIGSPEAHVCVTHLRWVV